MLNHLLRDEVTPNLFSLLLKLDAEQAELVVNGLCAVERDEREKAAQAEKYKLPGWRHLAAFRKVRAEIAADLLRKISAHLQSIQTKYEIASNPGKSPAESKENRKRRHGARRVRARGRGLPVVRS